MNHPTSDQSSLVPTRAAVATRRLAAALSIAFLVAMAGFLVKERSAVLDAIGRLRPTIISSVVATLLLQWIARTARDLLIYRELGYDVQFSKLYSVVLIQTLLNHLPFKPGTMFAAYALRREAGMELIHFGAVVLVHNLLMLVTAAGLAAMVVATHPLAATMTGRSAAAVLALIAIVGTLPMIIGNRLTGRLPGRFGSFARKINSGLIVLSDNPRVMIITVFLSLATFICATVRLAVLYRCAEENISIAESVVVTAASQLALVVSVTPGALGVRELFVGISSPLIGASASNGVIIASLERLLILTFLIVMLVPLMLTRLLVDCQRRILR